MKTTHIKNIVIWALVAVNALFLAFWFTGLAADYGNRLQMHRDLETVLERNGVTLDIRNIREGGELYTLESVRDIPTEQRLANTLLGATVMTVQGNNYSYTGEKGQAVFKNGGEFHIIFTPARERGAADAQSAARKILATMRIDAKILGGDGAAEGAETVTAAAVWNGHEIYNCEIRFYFEEGGLREISGRYAPNIKATDKKKDMTSCATAVMRFLDDVRSGKYSCTAVTAVRPGYRLSASLGDGSLEPVWRIETDDGVFYIDA
jgi:hypothetical protein